MLPSWNVSRTALPLLRWLPNHSYYTSSSIGESYLEAECFQLSGISLLESSYLMSHSVPFLSQRFLRFQKCCFKLFLKKLTFFLLWEGKSHGHAMAHCGGQRTRGDVCSLPLAPGAAAFKGSHGFKKLPHRVICSHP